GDDRGYDGAGLKARPDAAGKRNKSRMNDEARVTRNDQPQPPGWHTPPIIHHKHYNAPSVFTPESLLREARRQKGLPLKPVPTICVLDPDGDLVDHLHTTGRARRHAAWACYHTQLATFVHAEMEYGIVGRVVG